MRKIEQEEQFKQEVSRKIRKDEKYHFKEKFLGIYTENEHISSNEAGNLTKSMIQKESEKHEELSINGITKYERTDKSRYL